MKKTQEQTNEYLIRIRRMLVLNPTATIKAIADKMELDKDYVHKLVKKIRAERNYRLNYYTLNTVLAKFEDLISESDYRLWAIINNPESTKKDVISALKELRQNQMALFDKMFDAGVFERNLGRVRINDKLSPEDEAVLKKAMDYATEQARDTTDTPEADTQEATGD